MEDLTKGRTISTIRLKREGYDEAEDKKGGTDVLEENVQRFLYLKNRKSPNVDNNCPSQAEKESALIELKKRFVTYVGNRTDKRPRLRRVSAQEAMASLKIDETEKKISRRKKSSVDDKMLLQWAVTHNDMNTMQHLVMTKEMSLNEPGVDGLYPIHRAANTGGLECLKFLIKNGALVNVCDQHGASPLDMAVEEGEFDCALYLIESGADFKNIKDGFIVEMGQEGRLRSSTC